MLKSIGILSVVGVALLLVAAFPPDGLTKTGPGGASDSGCGGGACAKATAKSCGGCPATMAATDGETTACAKNCEGCPAGKDCQGSACTKNCANCPAAQGETKACQKDCAGCANGKCEGTACTKSCANCPASGAKETSATACAGGACGATACGKDCQDCPITAAMKALPQMTYLVGEEKLSCPKAAAETAQKANTSVRYAVGEKSFDTESDATLALAEATEQFVQAFAEPKVCKESGKVAIAGKELCCENAAAETAAVAKAAMDKIQMTYLVGEKECSCPVEAEKLAKDSGDPTIFVVAGESVGCNVTARLNLARAKYRAAVVAVMQAEAPATEKLTSKDS